jgi:hypothetical protein
MGAPTARAFVVISLTSHHELQDQRKDDFCPNSQKDQKSKVSGSTPSYLHRKGKPKRSFETHAQDIVRRTRRLDLFAVQAAQRPTHYKWGPNPHDHNVDPPSMVRQQGRRAVTPTILSRMCGLCSSRKQAQQANGTSQCRAWDANQLRNSNP